MIYGDEGSSDGYLGCIDPECDVIKIIQDAYYHSQYICEQYATHAPGLIVKVHDVTEKNTITLGEVGLDVINKELHIGYVPRHLFLMVSELLKNAMRSVVENCEQNNLPSIECLIVTGGKDLTIKISDQGGGLSPKKLNSIFSYLYSTASRPNTTLKPDIVILNKEAKTIHL